MVWGGVGKGVGNLQPLQFTLRIAEGLRWLMGLVLFYQGPDDHLIGGFNYQVIEAGGELT